MTCVGWSVAESIVWYCTISEQDTKQSVGRPGVSSTMTAQGVLLGADRLMGRKCTVAVLVFAGNLTTTRYVWWWRSMVGVCATDSILIQL